MTRCRWTCIIDFDGGTYVRQVWSSSIVKVLPLALRTLAVREVAGMTARLLSALTAAAEVDGGCPAPVVSMPGVFCASIAIEDELLLAHIVETARYPGCRGSASKRRRSNKAP